MRNFLQNFRKSESGATLVEYGVALIVAIIVGGVALTNLGTATDLNMGEACESLIVADGATQAVCDAE